MARDLIRGGDPVLVHEKSATQSLKCQDRIGARLVTLGERIVIGGGLLAFAPKAAALLRGLSGGADDFGQIEPTPRVDEALLRRGRPSSPRLGCSMPCPRRWARCRPCSTVTARSRWSISSAIH